jgi:hypothetical protein
MTKGILSALALSFTIIIITTTLLLLPHQHTIIIPAVRAETGKGTDVFKVIMTIFGLKKSTGQVVAIVTVNNNSSKVRVLDTSKIPLYPVKGQNSAEEGIMEFNAAFPNMTVNTGDKYNACVLPLRDLKLTCTTGQNSPAPRPEFVDISLSSSAGEKGAKEFKLKESPK